MNELQNVIISMKIQHLKIFKSNLQTSKVPQVINEQKPDKNKQLNIDQHKSPTIYTTGLSKESQFHIFFSIHNLNDCWM